MNKKELVNWIGNKTRPIFVAGPCSAETEEQVLTVAKALEAEGHVDIFRAGIWKPRTMPGNFEGMGEIALPWLKKVKEQTNLLTACEVANATHVKLALKYEVDVLWIGARTAVNPFSVQEIADAIEGRDITVMIKNPINVDLALWMGAIERFRKSGVKNIIAIHRGFSVSNENSKYRNEPMWKVPFELRRRYPRLPIICDPSHITGKSELIGEMSQKALDLGFDGLMIESHPEPKTALSDARQQVTPAALNDMLKELKIRQVTSDDDIFDDELTILRKKLDRLDAEILDVLSLRKKVTERIGRAKAKNNVTIVQPQRMKQMINDRMVNGETLELSEGYVKDIFQTIHEESVRVQTQIMDSNGID
ncbi:bifunctional 3-deoxy-7-phosphoheptulonate synthase/chorismate mutase type II [Bacteriovoracaceae bacterium]|nr:bifunctional 3-deoxy-7-phosphoheptulonate synthase/chorismate mutase type II [Bacteriovoracaceae bacterium]